MTLEQLLSLCNAGFTKAEIMAIVSPGDNSQTQTEPTEPAPAPEPTPEPAPTPAPAPSNPEPVPSTPDSNNQILEAIQNLTKTIQTNNIINTPQPVIPQAQSVDDIFRSMLDPKPIERK